MVKPNHPLERVEAPLPEPGVGEVLLKVSGCGVCHTDLGFFYDGVPIKSELPLTLGHEIRRNCGNRRSRSRSVEWLVPPWFRPLCPVVIVRSVKMVGEISVWVRKCPAMISKAVFASHIVVPAKQLCKVPVDEKMKPIGDADVSLEELSVVADAITTPYQAIIEAGLTERDLAVFIGVGGVGGLVPCWPKVLVLPLSPLMWISKNWITLPAMSTAPLMSKRFHLKSFAKVYTAWPKRPVVIGPTSRFLRHREQLPARRPLLD